MTSSAPSESLRERQSELTRSLIMEALASLIAEEGVADFSVQEVADRAGVSHRTVYRHYGSREDLLEGLALWLDERMAAEGGLLAPEKPEDVPPALPGNFDLFEQYRPLVEAAVVLAMGTRTSIPRRRRRDEEFQSAFAETVAHLDDEAGAAAVGVIRMLASSRMWFLLTVEQGLDASTAGTAVAWALQSLIDDLRDGGGPLIDQQAMETT